MNITDFIQVFVSIIALFLSYIAIKQTNKSIHEASRPYVVAYFTSIKITVTEQIILVIKNYGQSGAIIDSIDIIPELSYKKENNYLEKSVDGNPFKKIRNHFIAPGQSLKAVVSSQGEGMILLVKNRKVIIEYHDSQKNTYKEILEFDELEWSGLLQHPRVTTTHSSKDMVEAIKNLEKTISHTSQETITHNL